MTITYCYDPQPRDSGGTYRPHIVCDACGDRIFGPGNTYWLVLDSGDIHPQIWHTHKHPCSELDRIIQHEHGGLVLWEELDVWLTQLAHNLHHPLPAP